MVYDLAGNQLSHTDFDGHTTSMSYDPLNRVVSMTPDPSIPSVQTMTMPGNVTLLTDDGSNPSGYPQVVEERVAGNVGKKYMFGNRPGPIAMQFVDSDGATQTRFYHYDASNNVRFLTDGGGNVTDTYDYDAFGNVLASTGSTPNNYLFGGEYTDPDTGLVYLRARWMSREEGRFLSRDDDRCANPESVNEFETAESRI